MITPYNVLRHELVGLEANVVKSSHKGYLGIKGMVVDETRNTLKIRQENKEKKIPKDSAVFQLTLDDDVKVHLNGGLLLARSEDRIKKKIRLKFV